MFVLFSWCEGFFLGYTKRTASRCSLPFVSTMKRTTTCIKACLPITLKDCEFPWALLLCWEWGQKGKVTWLQLHFESKAQCNQSYDTWLYKAMAMRRVLKKMYHEVVRKVLFCSRPLLITRHHSDLEFLISRWSCESHNLPAQVATLEGGWIKFQKLSPVRTNYLF